jgi:hypothetical protein
MACWYVERRSEPAYLYGSVLRVSRTTPYANTYIHRASHSCSFLENSSEHHKSPFTDGAVALVILGFILSINGPPFFIIADLVSLFIVLCTCCCRVDKVTLEVAAVTAIIAAIGDFVFVIVASQINCSAHVQDSHSIKLIRVLLSTIGGVVWLVAVVLIFKIPVPGCDATPNQPASNTRQTDGDEMEA